MSSQRVRSRQSANRRRPGNLTQPMRSRPNQPVLGIRRFIGGSQGAGLPVAQDLSGIVLDSRLPPLPSLDLNLPPHPLLPVPHPHPRIPSAALGAPPDEPDIVYTGTTHEQQSASQANQPLEEPDIINVDDDNESVLVISETDDSDLGRSDGNSSDIEEISDSDTEDATGGSDSRQRPAGNQGLSEHSDESRPMPDPEASTSGHSSAGSPRLSQPSDESRPVHAPVASTSGHRSVGSSRQRETSDESPLQPLEASASLLNPAGSQSENQLAHSSTSAVVPETEDVNQRSDHNYFQSIPQVQNQVPDNLPPGGGTADIEENDREEPMDTDDVDNIAPAAPVIENPVPVITPSGPEINSSQADFRTPKKISAAAIVPKVATKVLSPEKSDDEGECCPICFENWTTSGGHRLVSLKCGHLFGQGCIDKWLRGQGEKCPQCNRKAKRSDIRVIYAKALKVLDTTAKDQALEALEKEKEARKRAEYEAADSRLRYQLAVDECHKLKQELERKRQQIESLTRSVPLGATSVKVSLNKDTSSQNNFKYLLDRNVEISKNGLCRVLTCSLRLGAIVISQPQGNSMFPGFGVKKLSTMDFRTTQFVHIHHKMIRDLAFNANSCDSLLLSASMDKMLKITSAHSNTVVQSYEAPTPIWSCCWNSDNGLIVYAGLLNGKVLAYDTRKTGEVLETINTEGSHKPVVALQYIPKDVHATFKPGGVLVGQLDRVSFYEELPDSQHKVHMMPLEGTLTNLSFEPNTRHFLASFRPSTTGKAANVRHTVCELVSTNMPDEPRNVQNLCTCHTVHELIGGNTMKMLIRSTLYNHPDHEEKLIVCAGDEATLSAKVWDASVGQLRQKLASNGPVIDTCQFTSNNNHFLTTLTEKSLAIYKWT